MNDTERDAPALIAAARDWLAGCAWSDMDADEIEALPADRVALGIARHYSGGILAFEMAESACSRKEIWGDANFFLEQPNDGFKVLSL